MDDQEDVKKMIDILGRHDSQKDIIVEDFIDFSQSDDEQFEDDGNDDDYTLLDDAPVVDVSELNSYIPDSTLKNEEKNVLDSCTDPDLKKVLLLNRRKNMQLIQLHKKIKDALIECQNNIKVKTEVIRKGSVKRNKKYLTGIWKLGAPYFKDDSLYSSHLNADVVKKRENNELSVYEVTSAHQRWTSAECDKLLGAVTLNYNINRQKALNKEILKLKAQVSTVSDVELDGINERIVELEDEMKVLQAEESTVPPIKSDEYIDWYRISEVFLKDKHSSQECKSFWHIYVYPQISKTAWTEQENKNLRKIAKKYQYQNWDAIADKLKTNRSAFSTCYHYFNSLCEKFKKGEFTKDEDDHLLELVSYYKNSNCIPWSKIVHHFIDRSRPQLFYRYTYYLAQQKNIKKGKFTEAEDILLLILVDRFGKSYKKCSDCFPRRTMIQLKNRYSSNLKNSLKKGSFTIEDDQKILDFASKQTKSKNWSGITDELRRCRGQVRQRYRTITQYLRDYPGSELKDVPRRKHLISDNSPSSFDFLRYVADLFKDKQIPSLDMIENILKQFGKPTTKTTDVSILVDARVDEVDDSDDIMESHSVEKPDDLNTIDDLLEDFFCNSMKVRPSVKCVTGPQFSEAINNVETILNLFNVNLELPEHFAENPHLDKIDVAILDHLQEKHASGNVAGTISIRCSSKQINNLMPPNMNTIVCLRGLLIKHKLFKEHSKCSQPKFNFELNENTKLYNEISWGIEKYFLKLSDDSKMKIKMERNLFYQRFHMLLKWAAILTLQNPNRCLFQTSRNVPQHLSTKRTYSKANQLENVTLGADKRSKMELIGKQPVSNAAATLKPANQLENGTLGAARTKTQVIGKHPVSNAVATLKSANKLKNGTLGAVKRSKLEVIVKHPVSNAVAISKLRPVDKSVVEFAMRTRSKTKLFRFDNIAGNVIPSVMEELKQMPSTSKPPSTVTLEKQIDIHYIEDSSQSFQSEDDLEDLNKLDVFLETESNLTNFSDSEDEFIVRV